MRAPASIVITGASIARHEACAGVIGTPTRASLSAGSKSLPPRKTAVLGVERAEPRGHARDGERRGADRVVDELLAERHLQLEQLGAFPDGTAQKQSRFLAVREAASQ